MLHNSTSTNDDAQHFGALPPEVEQGHVEYKLKLVNPSPERYRKLVTQLNWRLAEGSCMALYEVGVEDDGCLTGLNEEELSATIGTLQRMALELDAEVSIVRQLQLDSGNQVAEVLVRRCKSSSGFSGLKIAVVGGAESGKSTLLGVLTRGGLDNGRGKSRLSLFTHRHEIATGRTSSVCQEIMGFDVEGRILNYSTPNCSTWEQICEHAVRVVTFYDLAGHEKFLKTTVSGLSGHSPDMACLVVSAVTGVTAMTREHYLIAEAVGLPVFVVVTKIDRVSEMQLNATLQALRELLSTGGDVCVITSENELSSCLSMGNRPIFVISNVTGLNLKLLARYLRVTSIPEKGQRKAALPYGSGSMMMQIEDTYNVPDIGTVVGGTILIGSISEGSAFMLGPLSDGCFSSTTVLSIKRNRVDVARAEAGHQVTLALKDVPVNSLRRGMVLLDAEAPRATCVEFQASVTVLNHPSVVRANQQGMLHVGAVRQSAIIASFEPPEVATGDSAVATFKLIRQQPEYICVGDRFLFLMSDYSKISGEVTRVLPFAAEST